MCQLATRVQANKANSHSMKGWETFTDAVIQHISDERKGVVFLLWGKHAQVRLSEASPTLILCQLVMRDRACGCMQKRCFDHGCYALCACLN